MDHSLQLRLAHTKGCAVQAIWLTERHGFTLKSMALKPVNESQILHLELNSRGQSITPLTQALEELPDVREVRYQSDRGTNQPTGWEHPSVHQHFNTNEAVAS